MDDISNYMTCTMVAERYHISGQAVRAAIKFGWLKATKIGSVWLIHKKDAKARWGQENDGVTLVACPTCGLGMRPSRPDEHECKGKEA
jgi:hypothetical protein